MTQPPPPHGQSVQQANDILEHNGQGARTPTHVQTLAPETSRSGNRFRALKFPRNVNWDCECGSVINLRQTAEFKLVLYDFRIKVSMAFGLVFLVFTAHVDQFQCV